MFIVVAIVIFGIFVSLSYTLFGKTLQPQMVGIFEDYFEQTDLRLGKRVKNKNYNVYGDITPTDESLFNFNKETKTITGYKGTISDLVIPYEIGGVPVKIIGTRALKNVEGNLNVNLTSVTIPNSVEIIESWAFDGSTDIRTLKSVNLGKSVKELGPSAFGYSVITDIELPNSLKTISIYAFAHSKIKKITIPKSVTKIDDYAFHNQNDLKEVTILNNKENINVSTKAFYGSNPIIKYLD